MKRLTKGMAILATAATTTFGATMGLVTPAHADVGACTVTPAAGQHGGSPAVATCPAGAGTFTFRVAATCADAYPVLHLFAADGPWVPASATVSTTSSVPCNGTVPGSGFVWSASIETR